MHTHSLCAEIVSLCAEIDRKEYRLIELIRELDRSRPWRHDEIPSCAHWLNRYCGLDLVTAREKIRIARALPGLPAIKEAFRLGEISYSKVRSLTRVADFLNEKELLETAKSCSATHLAQRVKMLRQAERLQESKTAFDAYRKRSFTCHYDESGNLYFEGRLPADVGALLVQALDRATDWLFHDQARYRKRKRTDEGNVMDLSPEVRSADALAVLAERFLADPPLAEDGLNTADRYQVTVHAPAGALSDNAVLDPDDPPQVEDGPVLATETVRRLTCDGAIVRMLESGDGEPLDVGRKTRVIPPALRRAVKRRDKSCRYPDCLHARFTQVHHIEHWADGGKTCLSNLVLLCRHHHRLLHEGRYYIVKDGIHFMFFRPDGTEIDPGRETPLRAMCARASMRMHPAQRLPYPEGWSEFLAKTNPAAWYELAAHSPPRQQEREGERDEVPF